MTLSAGDRLGRYEILEPLGKGGMGEVYRARDERLDRDVAIKVLPEEVAQDEARLARFEREAKAVARLSHPNILDIHDYGREGEITYSVTELLEGETLRERIPSGGVGWQRAAEIGAAVAEGLAAAHTRGVIHRDLKPENIFITSDGRVKILDFGLARMQEQISPEAETGTLTPAGTEVGTIMGTVGYMAPEQVKGQPADARSDIFALGCVLYEMISGRRAFARGTTAETIAAILKEDPPVLSDTGTAVPAELERAIRRCLEKSPEARFQSASDLAYNLESISTDAAIRVTTPADVAPRRERRSITRVLASAGVLVVLAAILAVVWLQRRGETPTEEVAAPELDPGRVVVAVFENRTGDPALDSLGVLVSEAIAEGASGIGDFTVVSSPGSFGGEKNGGGSRPEAREIRELAESMVAGIVISGTYYLLDEELRFQTRMTDAATNSVLYQAPAIAGPRASPTNIIANLRQRVLGAVAWYFATEQFHLTTPPLLDAYLEYRSGRELFMQDLEAEVRHFRRAIEIDPGFFRAWENLVWIHSNRWLCDQAGQILDEMEPFLNRFTPMERARFRSLRASVEGRPDKTLLVEKEISLLTDGGNKYMVGLREMQLNRPRAAIEVFTQIPYPSDPNPYHVDEWAYWWLARAHHLLGEYTEELRVCDRTMSHFQPSTMTRLRQGSALAALGRLGEIGQLKDEVVLAHWHAADKMNWYVQIAAELRAHGHRVAGLDMAQHAIELFDSQPENAQRELRFARADALIHAERWAEAKEAADALLRDPWRDKEGRIVDEGERSQGGIWVGDAGAVVSLGRVGALAARLGEREDARQIDDQLENFESSCPAGNRTYQRACIACQLGDQDEAIRLLKEAIAQGYWGFWGMHADIHLEPLWDDPRFLELIRPKG